MKTETKRLCIYPKDLHHITRKSSRQSFRLLKSIRKELNKLQNKFVSKTKGNIENARSFNEYLDLLPIISRNKGVDSKKNHTVVSYRIKKIILLKNNFKKLLDLRNFARHRKKTYIQKS